MKTKLLLSIVLLLIVSSCALEKEESSNLYGRFSFTTAGAYVEKITQLHDNNTIIIDNNTLNIHYYLKSDGVYGKDPDRTIKNSYVKLEKGKIDFYLCDNNQSNCSRSMLTKELNVSGQKLMYNNEIRSEIQLESSDLAILKNNNYYMISILFSGREFNGEDRSTVTGEFGSNYGIYKIQIKQ